MSSRTAVALWTLALVASTGAALLVLTSDHEDSPGTTVALNLTVVLSFIGSGLIAWVRRPGNRTGMLLFLVGATWLLGALSESNSALLYTVGNALGGVAFAVFVHLLLAFPSGRLHTRLERTIVLATYGLLAAVSVTALLFDDLQGAESCPCPENVLLVTRSETATGVIEGVALVGLLAVLVSMLGLLARRWWVATPARRRALTPVLLTASVALAVVGAGIVLETLTEDLTELISGVSVGAIGTIPLAFLFGLLRARLGRGLVGRLLSEVPDDAQPAEVQEGLRRVLHDPSLELALWQPDDSGYVDVDGRPLELPRDTNARVTTMVAYENRPIAALVHDVSLRKNEPELLEDVVAASRIALERDLGLRALRVSEARNRALVGAIPDLMFRLRRDGTYLDFKAEEGQQLLTPRSEIVGRTLYERLPAPVADRYMRCMRSALERGSVEAIDYDLVVDGELRHYEGRIVASAPDEVVLIVRDFTGRRRAEAELERLRDQLRERLEELHASRARIVEAGDEARRRLERNLHDGAQQRLVSLSLALRLAEARLRSDADEACALLKDAREELAAALVELRELARGIHPAVLTDRGLPAALEALATRSRVPVELEGSAERLPSPIEAAAYYVVSEALANATKYADASAVAVQVERDDGRVVVEVRDDGVGGADPRAGSGLRGLADRIEALGGRIEVDSPAGSGTRIRAEIPL